MGFIQVVKPMKINMSTSSQPPKYIVVSIFPVDKISSQRMDHSHDYSSLIATLHFLQKICADEKTVLDYPFRLVKHTIFHDRINEKPSTMIICFLCWTYQIF